MAAKGELMRAISASISRRRILQTGGSLLGGLAVPSLLSSEAWPAPAGSPPFGVPLFAPDLTPTPTYLTCARPHRTLGVNLKQRMLQTSSGLKFLIHNYGHSGAGITLSFGCASVVADKVDTIQSQMQGPPAVRPMVAVLGCGVIGLTVASELLKRWPTLSVTIYSSHKETELGDITSFKAGGQFEPTGVVDEYLKPNSPGIDTLFKFVRLSYAHIAQIPEDQRPLYGIEPRWNYTLREGSKGFDHGTPHDIILPQTGALPFPDLTEPGRAYLTWLINPQILLPQLVSELKTKGATFRQKTFQQHEDWGQMQENILINCTGLGAATLFGGDGSLYPIRGQLAVFPNPTKLSYFFSGGCGPAVAYMFARQNDIVVGGTWEKHTAQNAPGVCQSGAGHHAECDAFVKVVSRVFEGKTHACHV
jgi:D-amino-acid oxidase